jgi:hypothetical protein
MNFNYSYKALVISALLVGNLVLLLYGIKLGKEKAPVIEEYEIEISAEVLDILEEELLESSLEKVEVTTHTAFNEDEKYISELENERSTPAESIDDKLLAMEEAIEKSKEKPVIEAEIISEKPEKEIKEEAIKTTEDRNSTNSFLLIGRKAIVFPNPIYICDGFGKVVLNIEVNAKGKVVKASFNKKTSTTFNQCLIESAIEYAKRARFTSDLSKAKQLGTIRYIFPGQ